MSDIPKIENRLPAFEKEEFHCPHCGVYAHQIWTHIKNEDPYDIDSSWCKHCHKHGIWVNEKMILPDTSNAPSPNDDLSDEVKKIYDEAAQVLLNSPRAAAALLRLALEKLCKELESAEKNLYDDIAFLVKKKGLSSEVADAMNGMRKAGNIAVHDAGTINLHEEEGNAPIMFELINFIARELITEPKRRKHFYAKLQNNKSKTEAPE